ncbi:hypothetical protein BCM20_004952 [Clostridium beijerinckii]|uniref:hypothetical protein n=1 Tax=Clostridium beijerinckii TaxID=1520 RepID=UPI00184077F6|nr:hypothetical protein [Clostridium beijerinckii]NOW07280.1 hypothetical protein [Clostridium beijerinckii]NRT32701.1 hypothetical protein [Clostridium beijerinckii]NRT47871.1 hypothetical protein [Clostridium beijerinckii]NRZ23833.1 hypothetical protein [Clostridium beijerinckii]NYC04946.1 hypothetical protein [Clostridium beijerinckii]
MSVQGSLAGLGGFSLCLSHKKAYNNIVIVASVIDIIRIDLLYHKLILDNNNNT